MIPPQSYRQFLLIFFTVGLFFIPTSSLLAQKTIDPISIEVRPEAPTPGVKTVMTITSSSVDLGRAQIVWSVNGTPVSSGSGVRSFSFTMGHVGEVTVVSLAVSPASGSPFTRTFTFRPGAVTLLWEADTYAPPFYVGKSLYSPGAHIRILALPNITDQAGSRINPSNLTFKWEINGDAYADRSGLGKDVLDIEGGQLREAESIGVDVIRSDGSKAGRGDVTIPATSPLVLFYKKDPLRGMLYERALRGNVRLSEQETSIVAEPYYIVGNNRTQSGFTYAWTLNGKNVEPQGSDKGVITLRQTGGQSGTALLSFSIQSTNLKQLLQHATASLQLVLSEGSNNIFGL